MFIRPKVGPRELKSCRPVWFTEARCPKQGTGPMPNWMTLINRARTSPNSLGQARSQAEWALPIKPHSCRGGYISAKTFRITSNLRAPRKSAWARCSQINSTTKHRRKINWRAKLSTMSAKKKSLICLKVWPRRASQSVREGPLPMNAPALLLIPTRRRRNLRALWWASLEACPKSQSKTKMVKRKKQRKRIPTSKLSRAKALHQLLQSILRIWWLKVLRRRSSKKIRNWFGSFMIALVTRSAKWRASMKRSN